MRILMLGPFPRTTSRIDGGVAAAMTYLCRELVLQSSIELLGARIAPSAGAGISNSEFDWPVVDIPLDRGSVSTYYLRQRRRLAEIVREYKPDVVHAQGADASGWLAVTSGVPSVVTVHGLLAECARYQTNWLVRARDRLQSVLTELPTIRRAKRLIVINPYVSNYYGDALRARTDEIPNAVAQPFFRLARRPEKGRILFAGRISKGKGVLELVQALSESRQSVAQVILAGSTPDLAYEQAVRGEVARLGLNEKVRFVGLLDEEELMEEFARAEALVLPSFQETAPMVIQQAMAAGLAVVATKVGGVPYQIQHNVSGLLFDPVNPRQLSSLFRRLDAEPQLSAALGEKAKAAASARYEPRHIACATLKVYEAVRA